MIKQVFFMVCSFLLGFYAQAETDNFLQIEKKGSGHPMILIHGMSCSAGVWDEVAEYYQNRYELHIVSIPGFGNQQTLEKPHILQAIRDALIDYVKTEDLHQPILMGHSMGGFVSLWAAVEQRKLFGKIVSIDGVPYFPVFSMPGITPETAAPIVEQMQQGMRYQTPETAKVYQEQMIATMIANEGKRARVVEMGINSNTEVIAQAMGEMFTTDIRDEMSAVEQPVLVLGSWYAYRNYGATKDGTGAAYKAQFAGNPNIRVEMADTAYHFIFYDEPAWFFSLVDDFLSGK